MRLNVYYMLVPTAALAEAAKRADEQWLLAPEVWMTFEHDRVGRDHSQVDFEAAAWTVFLAKLATEGTETETHRRFRKLCLELGFRGCWTVLVAYGGDSVDDLLKEARESEHLALAASRP